MDKGGFTCVLQDIDTKFEDFREFVAQLAFKIGGFGRSHLFRGEIKDFFSQKSEDGHVIFANVGTGATGAHDFRDEGGPSRWPFLFKDLDKGEVDFVDQGFLSTEGGIVIRPGNTEVDNKVADALSLVIGQDFPSSRNEFIQDGKGDVL